MTYDQEAFYVHLQRSSPPPVADVTIQPSPESATLGGYEIKRFTFPSDVRSWHSTDSTSAVHDCSANSAEWCQLVVVPLSDIVVDDNHRGPVSFTLATDPSATDPSGHAVSVTAWANFSATPVLTYASDPWGRVGYGDHIGPPPVAVTPGPVVAGTTPAPSPPPFNPPIERRAEAEAHGFVPGIPHTPFQHLSLDAIAGQSSLILSPDRSSILSFVQPSAAIGSALKGLMQCPDCSDYRSSTASVLHRKQFADLIDPKVDTSQIGVDDLLYDPATSLGPFDSSFTVSRVEQNAWTHSRFGISQFHGTAADGSFTFNDVVAHAGAEFIETNDETDAYVSHVVANHNTGRAVNTGAFVRYTNYLSHLNALVEYADQYAPGAQARNAMFGFDHVPIGGANASYADIFVGWQDSGPRFAPPDGTQDSLYGTRGPIVVGHLERAGNGHGTGSIVIDAFARRAFDATTVRRSNIGMTATYGLSNLYWLTLSSYNRPSAGSIIFAEAGQPLMVPSPSPAAFAQFSQGHYMDRRTAFQLKYSQARRAGDPQFLDRGMFEATVGIASSVTACSIQGTFICSALSPKRSEWTGSAFWLTPTRQFLAVSHDAIGGSSAGGFTDPSHSSEAVTDGYILASALGRCGTVYFGSQNQFGNGDPTKNGRTVLGSLVLPITVGTTGASTALRVEFKHRVPLVVAPGNLPVNSVNVQLVAGTPHYYAGPDVSRCAARRGTSIHTARAAAR